MSRLSNWWKIAPGKQGKFWKQILSDGVMMLGDYDLEGLGDLNQYDSVEELLDTGLYTQGAQILWDFYKSIQIGDYVAAYAKNHIIGIGTVTSGYQYGSYNKYGSSG